MLNKAAAVFVLLCAVFAIAPVAMAQSSTSGAIVGVITDPTGAVIPKADVQLVNLDTHATLAQTTNASGEYVFPNVTPGNYKITVTMPGFRTSTVPNVIVDVNKSVNQPIQLEGGGGSQVVEGARTPAG